MDQSLPEKKQIAAYFSSKAQKYERYAHIQGRILARLCNFIMELGVKPSFIADLGCGTGMIFKYLREMAHTRRMISLDIAFDSLKMVRKKYGGLSMPVQSDMEALPLKQDSMDLIIAASVCQWLHNVGDAVRSLYAVQKRYGCFAFSFFLHGTLKEIEEIRTRFDLARPVTYFSRQKIRTMLTAAGYTILKSELLETRYFFTTGIDALKSINMIGATAQRGKRLTRPEVMAFCREYENNFMTHQGVPLTYSVFLGIAQKKE